MGYEPLHHKYRPQTFADLVGQDAIATTLTNAIDSQRIAPAYLFTGPRGTGKTSSARILAKSLNCLNSEKPTPSPCGTCSVCREIALGTSLDVIEIDAASNTGVDNIRELIERAQFAPVQCRFKIYCLDEVHMLSTAAFNALLKTLEEPPAQVVFILATTDPQRVLATIISRCQRFDFRRIPLAPMVSHLTHIAEQESIPITGAAVELVAQLSQGGLRDAESLLDQLSLLSGEIAPEQIWDLAGSVPERELLSLVQAIMAQQPDALLSQTHQLLNRGRDPLIVLQNLTGFYRDLLIAKTAPDRRDLVTITEATWAELCDVAQQLEMATILTGQQHLRTCEPQVKNTTQPRLWLEVALLGLLPGATAPVAASPVNSFVQRPPQAALPLTVQAHAASPLPASPAPAAVPAAVLEEPPVQQPATVPQPAVSQSAAAPQSQPQADPPVQESPVASSPAPASPPPAAEPSSDLAQVWQQMLGQLHPAGRALFNQHGQLLSFSGNQARIGVPKGLVPTAQRKLEEVESAFQTLFHRPIKANLVINTPTAQPPAAPAHSPQSSPAPSFSSQPAAPTQAAAPESLREPLPSPAAPPSPVSPPPESSMAAAMPAKADLGPAPVLWETEDELTQTTRSFANFFGGAIVADAPEPEPLSEKA
ncbi:DNA polymerase III subunit tau [Acaryochloris thomasi RCC1774]|uniref:DNA polymerase III subunit gamma/tau n=1 Tax=Acaryochloris thomasi RCC1774 TaxID=1764569 RepID=A0A2W1JJ07_9CYAN|nr:DNA polymerase III subunit gamma/tau [Acaryochloris thomasi]PZD73418.1 DNA polymerase III subunit tau [Acaryochloris thomasi RCC1774]